MSYESEAKEILQKFMEKEDELFKKAHEIYPDIIPRDLFSSEFRKAKKELSQDIARLKEKYNR